MNSTNTSTITSAVTMSEIEYWIITVVFYGFGSALVQFGNIAIVIGIIRDHINLRTRYMSILLFLVSNRAVQSMGGLCLFLYRTFFLSNQTTVISCFIIYLPILCCRTLEMVLLLGLVVDRTLAIVYYRYYSTLNCKQALKACSYATGLTVFLKSAFSFYGVDFTKTNACLTFYDIIHPLYSLIWGYIDLILVMVTVVAYIALMLYVHIKFLPSLKPTQAQAGREEHQAGVQALRQHKKIMPALARMVILHCGGSLVDRIFVLLTSILPDYIVRRLGPYRIVPGFSDQIGNIVVLLYYDRDLRRAAFPCFDSSQTAVVNIRQIRNPR